MARMMLGALLCVVKQNRFWHGKAESWESYIATEGLNASAARQYIKVAKKFVYELQLDKATLRKVSMAGMTALEKAGHIITEQNKDAVIGLLTSLAERDAVQAIMELGATDKQEAKSNINSFRVLRLLKEYFELPPDQQIEFRGSLNAAEKTRKANHERDNV